MEIFGAVVFFVFGTIIGSFLNVVILRYNTGATLRGRSRCFSCGRTIRWRDLVPVASFAALGGRCRFCKSRLSFQYPLVEFITGLLFLGVFWKNLQLITYNTQPDFSLVWLLVVGCELLVFCLLVAITFYDLKHMIIPDGLVYPLAAISLVRLLMAVPFTSLIVAPGVLELLAGPVLALPFLLLWLVSRGRWMGLGDAKLAAAIGWFLGFSLGISAVIIAFWVGAIVGLLLIGVSKLKRSGLAHKSLLNMGLKNLTMKSEVPFAPFLIVGLVVVYFSGLDVMGLGALVGSI